MTGASPRARLLAETEWLAAHLDDPQVRVVDMRGYVRTVDLGDGRQVSTYAGAADDYAAGHIPNAIYLDWTRDIVDPDDPVPVQVAPPERFAAELGRRGIGDDHLIVAYDEHPAAQFATRLWWALRYYGHDRAMVLDGGLARWRRVGRPLTREVPAFPPATFTPRVQPSWRATGEAVIDPATGLFRPDEELRDVVARAGIAPRERVIAYCNGGVAATTVLFGLALAGHPHLTNYDGSWNEWGVRDEWPVDVPS